MVYAGCADMGRNLCKSLVGAVRWTDTQLGQSGVEREWQVQKEVGGLVVQIEQFGCITLYYSRKKLGFL